MCKDTGSSEPGRSGEQQEGKHDGNIRKRELCAVRNRVGK